MSFTLVVTDVTDGVFFNAVDVVFLDGFNSVVNDISNDVVHDVVDDVAVVEAANDVDWRRRICRCRRCQRSVSQYLLRCCGGLATPLSTSLTYICIYIYIYICICIYMYIYVYTNTCTCGAMTTMTKG